MILEADFPRSLWRRAQLADTLFSTLWAPEQRNRPSQLGVLTHRAVRFCVVLSFYVCGNILQQQQETITYMTVLHIFYDKDLKLMEI